jgi:hypothetical protein
MFKKIFCVICAITGLLFLTPVFGSDPSFIPEGTVKGNSLAGWHTLGQADWKVQDGEIVGTPRPGGSGGWLVLDKSYQDLLFFTSYKCTGACKAGFLLRAEKTPQGMKGVYVPLSEPDAPVYRVTLDTNWNELTREKLRSGGGRIAQPANANAGRGGAPGGAPGAPGAAGRGDPGGAGRGAGSNAATFPASSLPYQPPKAGFRPDDWNDIEIIVDGNIVRPFLNNAQATGRYGENWGFVAEDADGRYGPLALYVGGAGEVHFKNVSYMDRINRYTPPDRTSSHYRKQRLNDYYYCYAAAAGDFNHDGNLDIVSGPFVYYGPDFTHSKEIYLGHTFNPSNQHSDECWMQYAADFTGDGWDDVINVNFSGPDRGVILYVNPRGESRRWDKIRVVDQVQSEVAVLADVDGDGKKELVYSGQQRIQYAKPDPANPLGPWIVKNVSEPGLGTAHGIGTGDINGDGRVDIVGAYGWWEHPPAGSTQETWTYHPEAFGWYGRNLFGGAVMGVYDINGDGLPDVITSLNAHGYGLAWFEQKRDASGKISFVRHMIMDDFSTKNAGGVTFTQMHGAAAPVDMDGDGIPDFVIGKRHWAHQEELRDVDAYGPAVLYVYRTVRNPKAPGGAEFVPELVDNHSGAGSDVLVVDLNKDGIPDIVTGTSLGTYIFWGKPWNQPKKAPAAPARK